MNENQNCVIVYHDDGSVSFIPRECVLYITEWFEENHSVKNTIMNAIIMCKNNQVCVVGKYNRDAFSTVIFFNKQDTAEVLK